MLCIGVWARVLCCEEGRRREKKKEEEVEDAAFLSLIKELRIF